MSLVAGIESNSAENIKIEAKRPSHKCKHKTDTGAVDSEETPLSTTAASAEPLNKKGRLQSTNQYQGLHGKAIHQRRYPRTIVIAKMLPARSKQRLRKSKIELPTRPRVRMPKLHF